MVADKTFALSLTPIGMVVIGIDGAGRELARIVVAPRTPSLASDGGPQALVPEAHTPPLIDAAGTLIFATNEGRVGVATHAGEGDGAVELASTPCAPVAGAGGAAGATPVVAGLAPLGPDAVVAACGSGTAFAVSGRTTPEPGSGVGTTGASSAARSGERKPP
jgi:hypothetical protein